MGLGKAKATAGGILPEFSKFYCHPGRAGGSPFWIRVAALCGATVAIPRQAQFGRWPVFCIDVQADIKSIPLLHSCVPAEASVQAAVISRQHTSISGLPVIKEKRTEERTLSHFDTTATSVCGSVHSIPISFGCSFSIMSGCRAL